MRICAASTTARSAVTDFRQIHLKSAGVENVADKVEQRLAGRAFQRRGGEGVYGFEFRTKDPFARPAEPALILEVDLPPQCHCRFILRLAQASASAQNTIRGRFNMTAFEPPVSAPAFDIETLDGKKIAVGPGQVNKFVLLNFWATWCPPCVRELPSLQQAVGKIGADRFEVFAVSVDKAKDLATIHRFKKKFALLFPIGLDHESQIASVYGVNQFPSTFLVSPAGMILAAAKGERDWHSDPAISYFEEVMKRHA